MTRFLVAVAAVVAVSGSAVAADIPVKARPMPVMSWTGFYVNGGLGYGMWAADTKTIDPATGACVLCVE
jgi:outer membrane immunogenic protein